MGFSSRLKQMSVVCFFSILILSLALFGSARLTTHAASSSPAHSASCGGWSIIPSANVGSQAGILNSVSALSPTDVWAVGYGWQTNTSGTPDATLIEHWNGKKWSVSPSPLLGGESFLNGVVALSATDVWAVGYWLNSTSNHYSTLIEHWNGKKWSIVSSPSLPTDTSNTLSGIAQIPGMNELWVVGSSNNSTLIEQWNGTTWNVVPSPNPPPTGPLFSSSLSAITVIQPNDAWAVGGEGTYGDYTSASELIEHWDGTNWSIVADPQASSGLAGVAQIPGTNQLIAVGSNSNGYNTPDSAMSVTVIEQWNGTTWNVVPSPNHPAPYNSYSYLYSVVALSATNMWVVGGYNGYGGGGSFYPDRTLIEHWNGKKWRIVPSPNIGSGANDLNGLTLVPGSNQLWAVGSYMTSSGTRSLTERYC